LKIQTNVNTISAYLDYLESAFLIPRVHLMTREASFLKILCLIRY